ncbi:MAG TPA: enoyl-CoA hydratase family protein [Flexivirga sp.]|uniref:enoyl-CoA hydratase family protein n=1 Tax=Flexivirga sp. TaxID=1962927 RepID=UPI002BAD7714|nr:enoyl-CoA hydratase family protein [Flexivirga sp.]HWC21831.1 enoyl-CoA hydratase family protein [Flexivirga sp.]
MTTTQLVHLQSDAGIATITLDSQHNRNALSRQLVTELSDALAAADRDETVRAVLLTAAGPVFCSGADLSEAKLGGMEQGAHDLVSLQRQIVAAAKPVVIRLHGPVRAGGLGLVGAADIVIAADTVTFAFTEARLGLAPALISLTTLPRMTSRAAARTFLTAETFDAAAAADFGLITETVPADELDQAIAAVLEQLAQASPQGLRESKALVAAPLLANIDAHGAELAELSARLFGSDEAKAAMQAFLQRKKK